MRTIHRVSWRDARTLHGGALARPRLRHMGYGRYGPLAEGVPLGELCLQLPTALYNPVAVINMKIFFTTTLLFNPYICVDLLICLVDGINHIEHNNLCQI
ncbi:hypothetical protein Y032_0016g3030 [Ancylostoma ceylanicum]|uniref:Uncharacterized protein n=1 Tax=Ancylostoma ceylanicum TaxID=53326 RepID=A0A016V5K0_9BILA|nr:hypothetical protein Y032_0016g3030 [Ancylostoma ceylanicum]